MLLLIERLIEDKRFDAIARIKADNIIVRNFIWSIISFKSRASQGRKFERFSVRNSITRFSAFRHVIESYSVNKGVN